MEFPSDVAHLIQFDHPLAPHLWLGIGGPARYYAEPTTRDELIGLVAAASRLGIQVRVLGGGSNLLARESGVDALVVSLAAAPLSQLRIDGDMLIAGGGAKLAHAVTHAVGAGLSGLEHLLGIPGTVGGALVSNAVAGGRDIGSVTLRVDLLAPDAQLRTIQCDEAQFSHRRSNLGEAIILSATFQLQPADLEALTKRMQKLWIVRNARVTLPGASIAMPFVDPDGTTAERLINEIGMAGVRQGGASLCDHAPHILIAGQGASSDDCLKLIERVREQVLLQTGIDLQSNLQIW